MKKIEEVIEKVNGCWTGYGPSHHVGEVVLISPKEGGERIPARIISDSGIVTGVCAYVHVIDSSGRIRRVDSVGIGELTESDPKNYCTYTHYGLPGRAGGIRLKPHMWNVAHLTP